MSTPTTQYFTQEAGTKFAYKVNENSTTLQITLGGKVTGIDKITYRPYLGMKDTVEQSDFETPEDNSIDFATDGNGVKKHTFVMKDIRLSHIQVDDSGNTGDFWVHITQY